MAQNKLTEVVKQIRTLMGAGPESPRPDAQLLQEFVAGNEAAFAALVERHGAMVLGVSRSVLHDRHDAEDVCQATFLVLARKAGSIRKRESAASWLHGVAYRLARKVRTQKAKRQAREQRDREPVGASALDEMTVRELQRILHEELQRLPERYRVVLLLCYWEGKTRDEAAVALGWARGTFRKRLLMARKMLRSRLAARGLVPSAALFAALMAHNAAQAGIAQALLLETSRAATALVTGKTVANAHALSLAEGVLQSMMFTRLKISLALVVALGLMALGAAAWHHALAGPQNADKGEQLEKHGPPPRKEIAAVPANLPQNNAEPLPDGAVGRLGTLRWRHAALMLAFSPQGRFLAAAGDKTTHLFDGRTGKLVHEVAGSGYVAFSPDGKTLFTSPFHDAKTPKALRIWDTNTGAEKRQFTLDGNAYSSWSQDGKTMIAGQWKLGNGPARFVVTLWDMTTGKRIRSFVNPIGDNMGDSQVTLTPDGKAFALRGPQDLFLLDSATGKEIRRFPSVRAENHRWGAAPAFAFSPAGAQLVCTDKGGVAVWNVTGPAAGQAARRLAVEGGKAATVAVSPDGKFIAAGTSEGAILLWDAATGRLLHNLRDPENRLPIYMLTFSANGTLASQQHMIDRVRLWDVRTGKELSPLAPVTGLTIAMTPDGRGLAALDSEGKLWYWTRKETKLIHRIPGWRPGAGGRARLAYLDGTSLLVETQPFQEKGILQLFDLKTGQAPEVLRIAAFSELSPDGGKSVVAVRAGGLKRHKSQRRGLALPVHWTVIGLYDVRGDRQIRSFQVDAENVGALALDPAGKRLAGVGTLPGDIVGGEEGMISMIFLWDLASGKELKRIPTQWNNGAGANIETIAFAADGKSLITGPHNNPSGPCVLCRWDAERGTQIAAVKTSVPLSQMQSLALYRDRYAALASDTAVYLIDTASGKVLRRFDGHKENIQGLSFSADGRFLATASSDATALIWDLTGLDR
jgi:RNA polymerase sigma factor (sigma-70 family)